MDALTEWETKYIGRVDYVTKGHNPFTEHYGGVEAEVPLDNDPTTQLNTRLVQKFDGADLILLTGQALSHCVASTVRQLVGNFGDDQIQKTVLLIDTCSPVTGFEHQADDFVEEMRNKGMIIAKTTDLKITRDSIVVK